MYTAYDALPLTQIVARLKKYHSEEDCLLVERAYHFAEKAHEGQVRKSGEPYFIHPCYVASILTELLGDPSAIAAGSAHSSSNGSAE